MADFASLIDAETWAFIRKTERLYPPGTAEKSVRQQRDIYDAMCRAFHCGHPEGVRAENRDAGGVPVRHYVRTGANQRPLVLYLHGGGFVVGGLDSHDDICAEICASCALDVVSVAYRLCPEHPHPAAFDDAMTARAWATATFGKPVILAGDSAGGTLAAAVAHARRGTGDIIGQVLIYPGLGGDTQRGSYPTMAHAPLLTLAEIEFYKTARTGGAPLHGDATFAPLSDDDFSGLPPTLAISAQCDPLSDDARDYVRAITAAGGAALWINDTGLVHEHLRARHTVKRARASFARVLRAITLISAGRRLSQAALRH